MKKGKAPAGGEADEFAIEEIGEVEVNEEDMNDPELLAMMKEMGMHVPEQPKKTAAPAPAKPKAVDLGASDADLDALERDLGEAEEPKKDRKTLLEELILDTKKKYSHAKKAGDEALMQRLMKTYKEAKAELDALEGGEVKKVAAKTEKKEMPAEDAEALKKKLAEEEKKKEMLEKQRLAREKEDEEMRQQMFAKIIEDLEKSAETKRNEAVAKKRDGDMAAATSMFKEYKLVDKQLEQVRFLRDHPSKPAPPKTCLTKIAKSKVVMFPDIPKDVLRLTVSDIENAPIPKEVKNKAGAQLYLFGEVMLMDGLNNTKVHSPTHAGTDPVFNYTIDIPIKRTQLFLKRCERMKISLSLYMKGGFLKKDHAIGQVDIPIKEIATRAESVLKVPIKQAGSSRAARDSHANVTIQVLMPINGQKDIREEFVNAMAIADPQALNVLVETIKNGGKAPEPVAPKPQPQVQARPQPQPQPATPAKQPVAPKPAQSPTQPDKKAAAAAPAAAAPASADELGDLILQVTNLKRYVSYGVLEWELGRISAEIKAYKAAKKNTDDLETRKFTCQTNMDILQLAIDMGKLTEEEYAERLQKAIEEEKQYAQQLTKLGARDEAKLCLVRKKLMEEELEG